jgi:Acetoacetate decarboxylase (ADC)
MNQAGDLPYPIRFRDVHYLAALYPANQTKVEELLDGTGLQAGLHWGRKPLVALGLIQYKDSDLGAYNEIILAIPAIPVHEKAGLTNWLDLYAGFNKRKGGQYIIHIPVTTQKSVDAGRLLWGYPKIELLIEHTFSANGIRSVLFNSHNKPIIQVEGKQGFNFPIPAMNLMTYSFLDGTMLKTTVDVNCKMHWKCGSGLKIQVLDTDHPIGKDVAALEIDNKSPLFTIESKHFKAGFNKGQIVELNLT